MHAHGARLPMCQKKPTSKSPGVILNLLMVGTCPWINYAALCLSPISLKFPLLFFYL
jgi:hypothetical protein